MSTPKEPTELKVFEGKTKEVKLSSGRVFSIREKNGDDDDTISDMSDRAEGSKVMFDNMHKFIASIIVKDHKNNKNYATADEVASLKVADKFQLLLESRIHSDGPELNFSYICDNERCLNHKEKLKLGCSQDLNEYLKPAEDEDPEKPFLYRIFNHPNGAKEHIELALSSAKKVRYKLLTGLGEYKGLEITEAGGRIGKNLDLQIRDLEVWTGTDWQMVGSFSIFSSSEMREIRNSVAKEDPQWNMITDVKCPQCRNEVSLPLITIPDFFFPSEI